MKRKSEELLQFWLDETIVPVFFSRECFQGAARQVAARRTQPGSDIVGNMHDQASYGSLLTLADIKFSGTRIKLPSKTLGDAESCE
jgi:hypothetical protein